LWVVCQASFRIKCCVWPYNRLNEESKTTGRSCVGSSTQKDAVLIEQIKQEKAAISGARVTHFGVPDIQRWIDDHLSYLVAY
jgi:hypothetical protein